MFDVIKFTRRCSKHLATYRGRFESGSGRGRGAGRYKPMGQRHETLRGRPLGLCCEGRGGVRGGGGFGGGDRGGEGFYAGRLGRKPPSTCH